MPGQTIDIPAPWEEQQQQLDIHQPHPAPQRTRRWTFGMLGLAMLISMGVAWGAVYLFVPERSLVVGAINYSNFNVPTELSRRQFQAAQLKLLAADTTRAQARQLASASAGTLSSGFLATTENEAFLAAVQQAKWQDHGGGDESLELNVIGSDPHNDSTWMWSLLQAMYAANSQIARNTEQLKQQVADLDKTLSQDQDALDDLKNQLPALQATTRTSGAEAPQQAAQSDARLAAWAVATALADSDRADLNAARRAALGLAGPATQPADSTTMPNSAAAASPDPAAGPPLDNIPATAALAQVLAAAKQPDPAMSASNPSLDVPPATRAADTLPSVVPSTPPAADAVAVDPQLNALVAQLAADQHDLQQAQQTLDAQLAAGAADVDAKAAAFASAVQSGSDAIDENRLLREFADTCSKCVDATALIQSQILAQRQQLQTDVDRLRLEQRRIAQQLQSQPWKNDPDIEELNRELAFVQRLHDSSATTDPDAAEQAQRRIDQIGRQIDDIQALAGTEQELTAADAKLNQAADDAARRFETARSAALDAIDNLRRQFEKAVPDNTTYTHTQDSAQQQLIATTQDLIATRRTLMQTIPAVGVDTSAQAAKVAQVQAQIDDRWRALEQDAWHAADDTRRLAVCRAADGRRGQLIADEKSAKDAQAAFWTAYIQWQQQDQAARNASIAQRTLDDILRQIVDAQTAIRTTNEKREQANTDLQQSIQPRQPVMDNDVSVTPLESRQWWYVGAIGSVWLVFAVAMLANGMASREHGTPDAHDVVEADWLNQLPPAPPTTPGPRSRGGRLTA
jgi:hypothetical protein